jgi:uncharacterized Tic20 family protein
MGRLVRKPQASVDDSEVTELDDIFVPEVSTNLTAKFEPGDGYLERMLKYVPAETIAFSMIINAIFDQAVRTSGQRAMMAGLLVTTIAWFALLVGLILTPLLCWYVRKDGDAWIVNAIVSTFAFPFWTYLMGAVEFADFYDGNLAAILVLTFTVVSGLITPSSAKRERRETRSPIRHQTRFAETGTNLRERVAALFETSTRATQA